MKNHLKVASFFVNNPTTFVPALQAVVNEVPPYGVFAGDNLFTFGRNLSFLDDEAFMAAVNRHAQTEVEQAVIWRVYTLCWAAKRAMRLEGDLVECGCYKGTSARIVADYVGLGSSSKHMYLYDLFEHTSDMKHHAMPEHSTHLVNRVRERFNDLANVHVIQGEVPKSFEKGLPEKIAFLHVDMNNAEAEIGTLEGLYDRVQPGAIIVFDDYGWLAYRAQKIAEDQFFERTGLQILEIPTGQGILVK
jgi:O-methyltransferase